MDKILEIFDNHLSTINFIERKTLATLLIIVIEYYNNNATDVPLLKKLMHKITVAGAFDALLCPGKDGEIALGHAFAIGNKAVVKELLEIASASQLRYLKCYNHENLFSDPNKAKINSSEEKNNAKNLKSILVAKKFEADLIDILLLSSTNVVISYIPIFKHLFKSEFSEVINSIYNMIEIAQDSNHISILYNRFLCLPELEIGKPKKTLPTKTEYLAKMTQKLIRNRELVLPYIKNRTFASTLEYFLKDSELANLIHNFSVGKGAPATPSTPFWNPALLSAPVALDSTPFEQKLVR